MPRIWPSLTITVAVLAASISPVASQPVNWFDGITGGRAAQEWTRQSGRTEHCDIVVKRPGGNPTQDMTGSIGHAKSHQSNGGPARKRVCY